jgi:hypothetical protein
LLWEGPAGEMITEDDLQDSTTQCPRGTWTRYAQVSSTFKMIFKCFILQQVIVKPSCFIICNVYQKFGRFCKQNSKNKNKRAIYLNNDFYWLKMCLKRQIQGDAIPRKR